MTKILSFIGYLIMTFIGKTLRIREVNPVRNPPCPKGTAAAASWWLIANGENSQDDSKKNPAPHVVYALWHGEQFVSLYHHRGQGVTIMSSLSKDGEIQTGILKLFGYLPVRGSSSRRAERSLVEMIMNAKKGHSAAFAVDGPKGPYRKVKPGVIFLAKKAGLPIIPAGSSAKSFKVFEKAWDKYELPKLFQPAVVAYGEPIFVKKDDDIDKKSQEVENELNKLSEFAHKFYWSKDLKEYLANHPKPKILIVQPSRIGDVIFSLPTVAAVRKQYPHAWIGYFVDERCSPIVEGCPDIDEVIIFDREQLSPGYLCRLHKYLRGKNIDLSIDLHGLFKSAFMVWLAGARFRLASASTNGMRELSWLFSKEISPDPKDSHCVQRHLAVAKFLGCETVNPKFNISVPGEATEKINNLMAESGVIAGKPVIAVHPGGGWFSRRWYPGRFSALINKLIDELGANIILVGGKEGGAGEKGLNEDVISGIKGSVLDLTGKLTLKELAALLKRADVFIANEAGPMHIANGLGVKSVAILGPTDPKRTGPFGEKTVIIQHKVECQPCRERNCKTKKCMELVTVDEVFEAVKSQLRGTKPTPGVGLV